MSKQPTSPQLADLPKLPGQLSDAVQHYERPQLHHVVTEEKNVLPSAEDVKQEKEHEAFKESVAKFDPATLRQVSTEEKAMLPTQEDIKQEKASGISQAAVAFDKGELKHVEPTVKTSVEVIADGGSTPMKMNGK